MKKLYTFVLAAATALMPQALAAAGDGWKALGTGKFTDDIMTVTGLPLETWEVEIFENADVGGFYRVENPYGNGKCPHFNEPFDCGDILIHAENPDAVYMEYVQLKNIELGLGEPPYVGDMAGYYISSGYFDAATAIAMGLCTGKMVGGCITFESGSLLLDFPNFNETGQSFKTNSSGAFCVALPGASDFSFDISPASICAPEVLEVPYKAGADLAEVKYEVFKGFLNYQGAENTLYEQVKAEGKTAADGVIAAALNEGVNTLVVVALAPTGDIMGRKQLYCYGQPADDGKWKSIGKAEYSEDVLASIYPEEIDNVVYEVEVQESTEVSGRYRLVDPYGPVYPYYAALQADNNVVSCDDHHHYMVIDATDPDHVSIEASPLGLDFGYGQVSFFSEGWFGTVTGEPEFSPSIVEGFGTLKDRKITFLGGALYLYMPQWGLPRGNTNHKFYILLPETTGVEGIAAENAAEAEYFNLTGTKVARPAAGGIYIRRTGSKVEKVLVR